jgi:hypothetical protein
MRHPSIAFAPPESPVPAPLGTTGTAFSDAHRNVLLTSATVPGRTTARGRPAGTVAARSRR